MKLLVVGVMVLIIASLGSALGSMTHKSGTEQSLRVVHALTARIGLSVGLFVLLLVGYWLGWIQPHGLR